METKPAKKIRRNFTLDPEVNERLSKEWNASGLINRLLRKYFKRKDK